MRTVCARSDLPAWIVQLMHIEPGTRCTCRHDVSCECLVHSGTLMTRQRENVNDVRAARNQQIENNFSKYKLKICVFVQREDAFRLNISVEKIDIFGGLAIFLF